MESWGGGSSAASETQGVHVATSEYLPRGTVVGEKPEVDWCGHQGVDAAGALRIPLQL